MNTLISALLLLQTRTLPSLHLEPLNLKRLLPDADVVVAKIVEGTILVVVDVVVVLVADEVVLEAVETLEEAFPEIPTLGVLIVRFRVTLLPTATQSTKTLLPTCLSTNGVRLNRPRLLPIPLIINRSRRLPLLHLPPLAILALNSLPKNMVGVTLYDPAAVFLVQQKTPGFTTPHARNT